LPVAVGFLAFVFFMSSSSSNPPHQGPAAAPASKRVAEARDPEKVWTAEELKKYDGSNPTSPIYLACKGVVYDVTAGEGFYGPGGPYGVFSGRDASRALAKMDLKETAAHTNDLSAAEKQTLDEWAAKFSSKYPIVGKVVPQ